MMYATFRASLLYDNRKNLAISSTAAPRILDFASKILHSHVSLLRFARVRFVDRLTTMAPAFSTPVALRTPAPVRSHAPRMCARIPGDTAAAPSKYNQYIDATRLNKAPLITINAFPNQDYNNVTVSLATLTADEGAAASVAKPKGHNPAGSEQADSSLWSKYYDVNTVNTAPYVRVMQRPGEFAVGITMTEVPLQVNASQDILDGSIVRALPVPIDDVKVTLRADNKAPVIILEDRGDPMGADSASVAMVEQPLNLAAAEYILQLYR